MNDNNNIVRINEDVKIVIKLDLKLVLLLIVMFENALIITPIIELILNKPKINRVFVETKDLKHIFPEI